MVNRSAVGFEEAVGKILVEGGFITQQQLAQAREQSKAGGAGLLDAILSSRAVSQEILTTVISFKLRVPSGRNQS